MKGYSIHIGVNNVDKSHYDNLSDLRAAVNDAKDLHYIATEIYGYKSIGLLLNEEATSKNVINAIRDASRLCAEGDILFLTYSGHGGTIEDMRDGLIPLDERVDETWCLYDRQLIDDEIYLEFSKFKKVRILVISDSCHSGSVTKSFNLLNDSNNTERIIPDLGTTLQAYMQGNNLLPKKLNRQASQSIQANNDKIYRDIQNSIPVKTDIGQMDASVLLLAACQEDEVTFDGVSNGVFTYYLKEILVNEEIHYPEEIIETISKMYNYPNPNFFPYKQDDFTKYGNPLKIIPNTTERIDFDNSNKKKPRAQTNPNNTIKQIPALIITYQNSKVNLNDITKLYNSRISNISILDQYSLELTIAEDVNVWDAIHQINKNAKQQNINIIIEPSSSTGYVVDELTTKAAGDEHGFMPYWPPYGQTESIPRNWHLDGYHSQLSDAREELEKVYLASSKNNNRVVRIGHLDTGWNPNHSALKNNKQIRTDLARSFIRNEEVSNLLAEDYITKSGENQGHGTGTLGLISGGVISMNQGNNGILGAAPFIEIVPIRVTDSVIIINNNSIVKGIRYAIEIGCNVITMSLGGKPSIHMAKAINEAYEKGVVVVSAAGNCILEGIAKIGPKKLVYPARFDRVIAACGASYNQYPYDFEAQKNKNNIKSLSTRFMQGNWGPKRAMQTAMAAYTPNVPWLVNSTDRNFVQSGGGTSSATPQIASAVALWLYKYDQELKDLGISGTWKQVEAVRNALFSTADLPFKGSEKYYGNGVLKASKALQIAPNNIERLKKSKKAIASPLGLLETINLFLRRSKSIEEMDSVENELLALELIQIIDDLNLDELVAITESDKPKEGDIATILKYRDLILSQSPSIALKKLLGL